MEATAKMGAMPVQKHAWMGSKKDPTKFYTRGEEIFNAVTHGVGSLAAVVGTSVLVTQAAMRATWREACIMLVYGLSLIILYTMSTLYHSFTGMRVKKLFRVFDHTTIFLLIAGTYTPFTLITVGGTKGAVVCGVIWATALLGVVANAIALDKVEKLSMVLYVVMGWSIVFAIGDVIASLHTAGIILLVAGGVSYTGGITFFYIKKRYMHSIWHLFVLAGSLLHFLAIALYVLPTTFVR